MPAGARIHSLLSRACEEYGSIVQDMLRARPIAFLGESLIRAAVRLDAPST